MTNRIVRIDDLLHSFLLDLLLDGVYDGVVDGHAAKELGFKFSKITDGNGLSSAHSPS